MWEGFAIVRVDALAAGKIVFHESGEWKGRNLSFSNTLRWSLQPDGILLERVRLDSQAPPCAILLESSSSYSGYYDCGRDRYRAELFWDDQKVYLNWSVEGPMKREQVKIVYCRSEHVLWAP